MDFKQLQAFIEVASSGSVTRAAEVLHVVQPAVSRRIRLLEDSVGARLFERQRHGMVLTPAGRILADHTHRALLELERARAQIESAGSAGITGLATIGLLPSTADILSGRLMDAMARAYPGIQVRVAAGYAGNLLQWLLAGEVDAALLYGARHSAQITTRQLVAEPMWLIGPPGSGLRPERAVAFASLGGKRLILPSTPHGIRALIDHACAIAHVELEVAAETNALSIQRSLTLGGHGLTVLPPIAVADDLRRGRLVGSPLSEPEVSRTIVLALPAGRSIAPHVRHATDTLARTIREAVASGDWIEARWVGD